MMEEALASEGVELENLDEYRQLEEEESDTIPRPENVRGVYHLYVNKDNSEEKPFWEPAERSIIEPCLTKIATVRESLANKIVPIQIQCKKTARSCEVYKTCQKVGAGTEGYQEVLAL